MISTRDALASLYPNAMWVVRHEPSGEVIECHDPNQYIPTTAEIQAEKDRLMLGGASSGNYVDLRKGEYPPIADQLDMIYHDQINGTTVWRDTITGIKAKYLKP